MIRASSVKQLPHDKNFKQIVLIRKKIGLLKLFSVEQEF